MNGSEICRIDYHSCIACGACAVACPEGAVIVLASGKRAIVPERCTGCGICMGRCIGLAITKTEEKSE